jgi:hypothetical protein
MQEYLVASELVPSMSANSALAFLKDLIEPPSRKRRKPRDRAMVFLKDFCYFYLSRNLAAVLRSPCESELEKIDKNMQYTMVVTAFEYLQSESDIDLILKFISKCWAHSDFQHLVKMI